MPIVPPRGWTPDARVRFLEHLAVKGHVRAACARVGLSAEAAYRLRRRDPLFARGWAAAVALAREVSEQALATRALDGVEEPVFYRGEQVGVRHRYDTRLLLAHLARLDRMAERGGAAVRDAGRFDEMLALIAGEAAPGELADRDGDLPAPREAWGEQAAQAAKERVLDAQEAAAAGYGYDDCGDYGEEDEEDACVDAGERARQEAGRAARAAAEAQWDAWFTRACAAVDRAGGAGGEMRGPEGAAPLPGDAVVHPSHGAAAASPSSGSAAAPSGSTATLPSSFPRRREPSSALSLGPRLRGDDEKGVRVDETCDGKARDDAGHALAAVLTQAPQMARFGNERRTVSTVSTSALARGLEGPVRHFALASHPAFHARKRGRGAG